MDPSYAVNQGPPPQAVNIMTLPVLLVWLVFAVLMIVSMWKVFEKAGQPGWAAIVPIYNLWVMVKIAGLGAMWFVLYFIPCVSIAPSFYVPIQIGKAFGKGIGFGLGLIFLPFIFLPILAFGDAEYCGVPEE